MPRYEIEVSRTAEKRLRKLPRPHQARVARRMLALADDPVPPGARKLTGYEDVYRIRVGRYRVLYSVSGRRLVVIVLKIGHRKDIFRKSAG